MSADADLATIEQALAELLRLSSSRRVHQVRMRAIDSTLSRTELRFLSRVAQTGPRSVSALADELDVSQPTASRALRRLEDEGLVQRRADSTDGRIAIYGISADGGRQLARVQELMHAQLADALAGLPPNRRHDLAVLIDDLAARLRSQGGLERTAS